MRESRVRSRGMRCSPSSPLLPQVPRAISPCTLPPFRHRWGTNIPRRSVQHKASTWQEVLEGVWGQPLHVLLCQDNVFSPCEDGGW
jgi:hypothetical protein